MKDCPIFRLISSHVFPTMIASIGRYIGLYIVLYITEWPCVFLCSSTTISLRQEIVPRYLNNNPGLSGLELYTGVKSEIRCVGQPLPISLTVGDSDESLVIQTRALFFQCGLTNSG